MMKSIGIVILMSLSGITTANAQWSKQDSVRLQRFLSGEEELKLNDNAVKSIRFGIPKEQLPGFEPMMSTEKPVLQFKEDLPDIFTDSLAKYRQMPTLHPYTIFTRYNEDPIHAPDNCFSRSWASKLYPNNQNAFDIHMQRVSAGRNSSSPIGPGISFQADFNHILSYLFSKRYRTQIRNSKNANAWKTY